MRQSYSISKVHKIVLNFKPRPTSCMSRSELECLKNLSGRLIYLWLHNKNGFWYRIYSVKGNTLYGYMMTRNRWYYYPVSLSRICCFY